MLLFVAAKMLLGESLEIIAGGIAVVRRVYLRSGHRRL
jgi:hypothetical protein